MRKESTFRDKWHKIAKHHIAEIEGFSVLSPVNGININTLLHHLPKRAHVPQPLHGRDNFSNDKIYLRLGRETTNTESK